MIGKKASFNNTIRKNGWKIHDVFILILSGLSGPFVIFLSTCLLIKRLSQRGGVVNAIKNINFFDILMILCCIIQVAAILMSLGSSVRSSAPLGASFSLLVNIRIWFISKDNHKKIKREIPLHICNVNIPFSKIGHK